MLHRIINTQVATIYIWHITETSAQLGEILLPYKELALEGVEENLKQKLWHHTHFLSTRILLFKYAQLTQPITKNKYGKPIQEEKQISITHSNNFSAIIVSNLYRVAIDLEKIDDRILRVAHKFQHEKESFFTDEQGVIYTTLIWSAKETLYKLYTENEVIFKDELHIHPFEYSQSGKFRGDILKNPQILNVTIAYFTFDNYILTWCKQ